VALPGLTTVRDGLGQRLFGMVAGPEGPTNRARIHDTPGPRWFAEDRPIRRVHGDASMFVGGLRALLLQSLHPLAMAGVAEHSDYRGDPWGRLQRTSTFLAVTTFGPADDAQRAVDKVRGIHRRVRGTAADGRPYEASDPHLLEWVHIAEIDSFLLAHQLYGADPLDQQGRDDYVADTARVAHSLGVIDPPRTERELKQRLADYRPELSGTPAAREAAKFLLLTPHVAAVGQAAVRHTCRHLGGHAARVGTAATAPAVPATSGEHGRPGGRPNPGGRYPLGTVPRLTDPGRWARWESLCPFLFRRRRPAVRPPRSHRHLRTGPRVSARPSNHASRRCPRSCRAESVR
jgi:uncharacterized protein (DUF2236 family)